MEKKSRWQRFKEWWTIDHVVDGVVDIALLLFDVITSPILITIRIIRHFIGERVVGGIKSIIKTIVRWFARKREYRLEHGHGIFRTYWYLILTSPIIFFILFILLAMITGIAQDLPEMLELLLRGCQEGSQYWCNTDLW
jgi:Sec-independent protein secretion pathway component TatC